MALDPSAMAALIITNLKVLHPNIDDYPLIDQDWTAICSGIVSHIKSNMVVHSKGTDSQDPNPILVSVDTTSDVIS